MKAAETVSFLRLSSALLGQQRLHEYGAHSSGGVLVLHTGCRNASAAEVTACIELWEDILQRRIPGWNAPTYPRRLDPLQRRRRASC